MLYWDAFSERVVSKLKPKPTYHFNWFDRSLRLNGEKDDYLNLVSEYCLSSTVTSSEHKSNSNA